MVNEISDFDCLVHSDVRCVFFLLFGYWCLSVVAMIYFYLVMTGICGVKIILKMGDGVSIKSHGLAFFSALLDAILIFYFAGMAVSQL